MAIVMALVGLGCGLREATAEECRPISEGACVSRLSVANAAVRGVIRPSFNGMFPATAIRATNTTNAARILNGHRMVAGGRVASRRLPRGAAGP